MITELNIFNSQFCWCLPFELQFRRLFSSIHVDQFQTQTSTIFFAKVSFAYAYAFLTGGVCNHSGQKIIQYFTRILKIKFMSLLEHATTYTVFWKLCWSLVSKSKQIFLDNFCKIFGLLESYVLQGVTANFAGWVFLEFIHHASRYEFWKLARITLGSYAMTRSKHETFAQLQSQ